MAGLKGALKSMLSTLLKEEKNMKEDGDNLEKTSQDMHRTMDDLQAKLSRLVMPSHSKCLRYSHQQLTQTLSTRAITLR